MRPAFYSIWALALLLSLSACSTAPTVPTPAEPEAKISAPLWFTNRSMGDAAEGHVLGFGTGKNNDQPSAVQQAKQNALAEIAAQIQTRVDSEIESNTFVEQEASDEYVSKRVEQRVRLDSKAELNDMVLHKQMCAENPADQTFQCYVAYSYDNRALAVKIKELSCTAEPSGRETVADAMPLSQITDCDWQINYRHGGWYVELANKSLRLHRSDWLKELFTETNSPNLRLSVLKNNGDDGFSKTNNLRHGDFYFIELEAERGFLSLFVVNALGQVQRLFDNEPIKQPNIQYPDNEIYDGLLAENDFISNQGEGTTRDMVVAIRCGAKQDAFGDFIAVDEYTIEDSELPLYAYDKLLAFELSGCDLSTQLLSIR